MLRNFYLSGLTGYWLCMLILNENLLWCVMLASRVNLVFITIERYLKVVHPVWGKNKLRNWMIYSAIAFAWISGCVQMNAVGFSTSVVINGICYGYVIWKSSSSRVAYAILYFSLVCIFILITCIFCYWRILIVIRRQAKVMASHVTAGQITSHSRSHQIQSNVIKTMILVSAFYALSDMPMSVYYLLLNIQANLTLLDLSLIHI